MTRFPSLTGRGWGLLAGSVVMAMAGWLVGIQELYALAVAGTVLITGAVVWGTLSSARLDVSRRVHPNRVPAGGDARVELTIVNIGRRRTPPLSASDAFDGGVRYARFGVSPLRPGESRRASYRLPSAMRGIHHLGPLSVDRTDPIGLVRATSSVTTDTALTVHPRFEVVATGLASAQRNEERIESRPLVGRGGSDFYTLRHYVTGDDLRRIHWPTTARLDELVVRQAENLKRGRLTVMVDLREPLHDDRSLDVALSAAATMCMSGLAEDLQVRLVTTEGFDSGHRSGRDHGPGLLDVMAAAQTHRFSPASPFRAAGPGEPAVIVTTDRVSPTDISAAMSVAGGPGGQVTVVEVSTRGGPADSTPGAVRISAEDELPVAWQLRRAARW